MQKGQIVIWIVVGALVIAIAGGAYYLGRSSTPKPSPTPVVTSPASTQRGEQTPQPTSIPSPTPDEIANWKTYSDLVNPYNVKYPPDWAYASTTDSVKFFPPDVDLVSSKSLEGFDYISVLPLKNLEFNAKVTEDTKVNVAGQLVRKVAGIEIISDTGILIHVGPLEYNGRNYLIVFTSGSHKANQKNIDVFNQMLSTFKFL